jgi:hypothetical protein
MFGDGKHRVEFGLRQSRKKAGPESFGKTGVLVSGREFAGTIHEILSFQRNLRHSPVILSFMVI